MRYNFAKIGEVIKRERKAAGFSSHAMLCEHLRAEYGYSIKRETLGKIENGETSHYDCELLYILCEIFNCEMGYLLGEYDCKSGRNTDIEKEIGINEAAINTLSSMYYENSASGLTDVLTLLINNPNFQYFLSLISSDADSMTDAVTIGNTYLMQLNKKDIINSALKDTVLSMAYDIRKQYTPNEHYLEYDFLFNFYHNGKISYEEMQDIKEHYDNGDFEYVPHKVHLRLTKQKKTDPKKKRSQK